MGASRKGAAKVSKTLKKFREGSKAVGMAVGKSRRKGAKVTSSKY